MECYLKKIILKDYRELKCLFPHPKSILPPLRSPQGGSKIPRASRTPRLLPHTAIWSLSAPEKDVGREKGVKRGYRTIF